MPLVASCPRAQLARICRACADGPALLPRGALPLPLEYSRESTAACAPRQCLERHYALFGNFSSPGARRILSIPFAPGDRIAW